MSLPFTLTIKERAVAVLLPILTKVPSFIERPEFPVWARTEAPYIIQAAAFFLTDEEILIVYDQIFKPTHDGMKSEEVQ